MNDDETVLNFLHTFYMTVILCDFSQSRDFHIQSHQFFFSFFLQIANDQVSVRGGGEEAEKSQYLNGIMLQCQHFRFNVASIICEVSEMKTVFRIKTFRLLAGNCLAHLTKTHTLFWAFWQIALISLQCHRLITLTHFAFIHIEKERERDDGKNKSQQFFWAVYIENSKKFEELADMKCINKYKHKIATFSCN